MIKQPISKPLTWSFLLNNRLQNPSYFRAGKARLSVSS
ncbi:hypothetical protein PRUB_b0212 [Pseudoalteromonas rubra]|uniref:Uncharacterized protein n=1 Tax=Pseudoalteromonas rubra TaxID=43658 RepID=A0A8T0C1A7_9GAMM|nr:hypothetical protein PRUB_b0212 [Pseudoalteromonas rubra]